jgi:hypothetical protein
MSAWVAHIFTVIPHTTEPRFMMIPAENGWTLPMFILHKKYSHLHLLQRAIRDSLHAEITVLYWIHENVNEEARITRDVWMMENHTADWQPPADARWIDRAALDSLTLENEWMRQPLNQALDMLTEPTPEKRPPWYRQGWFRQAQQWTTAELTRLGYTPVTPPEQFKQFSISSLLVAETTSGTVYFKVANTLPLFGHEPNLLKALSNLFPRHIPAPIAIDVPRRWMLCADFGQQLRGSSPSYELLENIMREFAALQVQTASMLETLFAAGCLDRRLNVLAGQIDALIADEASYIELNAEERAAWQASAPALKRLCERLAEFNIPPALVHGDFHAGNVAVKEGHILFFDWTDACVTHPFFDVPVFIDFDAKDLDEAQRDALRDAYLSLWTAYEPMERLREAYQLAVTAGALHQAVSYQHILNAMEPRQRKDWQWGVPYFARIIVKQLQTLTL